MSNVFDLVAEEVATLHSYGEGALGLFQTREICKPVTNR
jgi:hypothetical protein